MIERDISESLNHAFQQYPVITVLGPRQSGKTTIVRHLFNHLPYYNFERPDLLSMVKSDPQSFLAECKDGAIIDEVQNFPEILSYIQAIVDEKNENGQFVLTGSQQLGLHEAICQSLAGRTAILELLPLSISELKHSGLTLETDEYIHLGGLPAIHATSRSPESVFSNYIRTYLERDLRQLVNVRELSLFQKFLKLTAGRVGSILNRESLSGEVGVSATTIEHWLSMLQAGYVLFKLTPYFENLGKRIIKSPKIYFSDVGIVTSLIDIRTSKQVSRDPLRGHLFENLVVLELYKQSFNLGLQPNLYFYRDNHGNEVDIIFKVGQYLIPIEIKSSTTFNPTLLKGIHYFFKQAENRAPFGFLIYAGEEEQRVNNIHVMNYRNTHLIQDMIEQKLMELDEI